MTGMSGGQILTDGEGYGSGYAACVGGAEEEVGGLGGEGGLGWGQGRGGEGRDYVGELDRCLV